MQNYQVRSICGHHIKMMQKEKQAVIGLLCTLCSLCLQQFRHLVVESFPKCLLFSLFYYTLSI